MFGYFKSIIILLKGSGYRADKRSVLLLKDYGHVEIRLKELLDKAGMTRNALADAIGSNFEVVNKWYSGALGKIDADVLARICYVLQCRVEDLIVYRENRTE